MYDDFTGHFYTIRDKKLIAAKKAAKKHKQSCLKAKRKRKRKKK